MWVWLEGRLLSPFDFEGLKDIYNFHFTPKIQSWKSNELWYSAKP